MKGTFTLIAALLITGLAFSQQLAQVTFKNGSTLSYFSFVTDQGTLIRISDDGKILEWGIEVKSDYYDYYAPRLQPYMGKVDYYGKNEDSVFRGKVKSIGTCFFTYFDTFQVKTKIGKLRSIGNQFVDYFADYEDKTLQGKLKAIGAITLDYYKSYENESYRGKLKSIGFIPITYYSVFDDKVNAGKIKSVGNVKYLWGSLNDHPQMRGQLKTNNRRQVISGVTYILE